MASRGWERDEDLARRDDASSATAKDAPATQDGGEDASNLDAPVVTQKRRRNMLRESHLVSADVSGRESQALASLINMYKQWAFDLYPGLNFEDFIDRAETLGKGHQVQGLMMELREKEKMKAVKKREEEEEKEREEKGESDSEGEEAML
ncbi:Replication Fork Protection Component Swi3 [Phytophthora infestans]|uniref:Replication Fork Protection Component Swi3 n=1 Tax=Phytophthora infestans TaxID=4787 RepID=A0A833SU75_PHYIN|nr:Replication Fork Protection Component Swi3 [Phytophthora infestans]